MSAMEEIPYEQVFAGQVREIQGHYPQAHQAMVNWGNWSRRLNLKPFLCRPALWNMVKADREEWGEEQPEEQEERKRSEPLLEVGRDPNDQPKPDDKLGYAIDILIHSQDFAAVWRVVLKAAYFTREIPEYQMPREADVGFDSFILFLDGALGHIQRVLDAQA
jgi:hypothetical protein